jgi:hypothetical protein
MKKGCLLAVSALIWACNAAHSQDFLVQDFNSTPPGTTFPSGWQAVQDGDPNTEWKVVAAPFTKYTISLSGGRFAICDADAGGSGSVTNSTLTSPEVNTASTNNLILEFFQAYRDYSATTTDSAIVEVFNGSKWIAVQKKNTSTASNGATTEKASYVITPYKNAAMKIRFRYVGEWPWFWGVDNIRIYQPPANDVGVTAITSPVGGCGLSGAPSIKVKIANYGSLVQNSIPVFYKINAQTTVSETCNFSLAPGAEQEFTFSTPGSFPTPGDYFISAWSSLSGDVSLQNDSVKNYKVTRGSSNFGNLSFSDYDGVNISTIYPGWREGGGNNGEGITSTWRPSEAVQTEFFGTKTAVVNLFTTSRKEWIVSPPIVPTTISGLSFRAAVTNWLTTEPEQMGSDDQVSVMVTNNCGVSWTPLRVFNRNSNLSNSLTNQTVSLVSYAGSEIQLAFFATDGPVEDPEDCDFHIDSLRITNLPPNELSVGSITSPVSGCSVGSPQLKVNVVNGGTNPQTNFQICAIINGVSTCQNFSGTLAPGTSSVYTFSGLPILNTPGDYNIRVYVNLPNEFDRSNDTTGNYFFQNIPTVATFPYNQSFETSNGGWIPGGTFSSWALGTPNKPVIKKAGQGTKAYVTGGLGNGTYNPNEKSFVLGPCMNFSSLQSPVFEMKAWWASEFSEDGAALQASIDGGNNWTTVGNLNDVSNWYNDNSVDGLTSLSTPPRRAWSGGLTDAFGSGGWVTVKNDLTGLGGIASVRLRIVFGSNATIAGDGFAFDDIKIYEKANRDLAIVSFERPRNTGCGLSDTSRIWIRVKNVGKQSVTNPVFGYRRLTGGQAVTQTSQVVIDTNAFYTYSFTVNENLSQIGTYQLQGWVNLSNDEHRSNDTIRSATFLKRGLLQDTVLFQGFTGTNLPALYNGWGSLDGNPLPVGPTTQWRNAQPNQQAFFGKNVARMNMFGNNRASWIFGPAYQIQPNAYLNFDVATTSSFDTINATDGALEGTDDRLRVMVSTNCGASWTEVFAVKTGDNVNRFFKRFKANLSAFAGQEVRFAFWATTFPVDDNHDYDIFLDRIFVETLEPLDGGVSAILAPLVSCGLSESIPVKVTVRNFGGQPIVNFPIFYKINQEVPVIEYFTQTIQPGGSFVYTFGQNANLSLSQPYTIVSGVNVPNDNNAINNTASVSLFKVSAPFPPAPLSGYNGNNLGTIWPGWNEARGLVPVENPSSWTNGSFGGESVLRVNLAGNQKTDWILSPGIKVGTNNFLKFKAGLFAQNGSGPAQFDIDDSVSVVVSTDCGQTWKRLFKLGSATSPALTNNMQPYSVSLAAYNNQEIRIGFRARDGVRIDFVSDLYLNQIEIVSSIQVDAAPFLVNFTPSVSTAGSTIQFIQDTTYLVSATINNFGGEPISNIPVAARFSSENLLLDSIIPGPVNPGQSVEVVLGSFTASNIGQQYRAKIYTSLPGDNAVGNDTLSFNYLVVPVSSNDPRDSRKRAPLVYPNPVSGLLNILTPDRSPLALIRISDLAGRVVFAQKPGDSGDGRYSVPLSSLPSGIYNLEIVSESGIFHSVLKKE